VLLAFALVAAGLAPFLGEAAVVTAIMVAPLPLGAFNTPATVQLERQLEYRPVARIDVAGNSIYQGAMIVLAVAGTGPIGVSFAVFPRVVAITVMLIRAAGCGWIAPRWKFARTKGLLSFGIHFQLINATNVIRDQALNVGLALIGGYNLVGCGRWRGAFYRCRSPSSRRYGGSRIPP